MPTATRTIPEELAGMRLDQALPPEAPEAAAPEPMPLDVVYEDEEVLVINKPAGLVVHPGAGNVSGTLMNGLLAHAAGLAALPRAGIIHRIDKLTTGLLVVGKTLEAHTALTRALADHDIRRQYVAVVAGVLTGGGRIDAPIGRHPVDRTRMAVRDSGKPAVTHYTVRAALRGFRRQALHAARLEFQHPLSGKTVVAEAALPDDMESLMAVLRQPGAGKSARA